jgi:hypothetical protein
VVLEASTILRHMSNRRFDIQIQAKIMIQTVLGKNNGGLLEEPSFYELDFFTPFLITSFMEESFGGLLEMV